MEKIQVQIEEGKATRGMFARPLVLVTLSAVLVTSVLAVLFTTSHSAVEFGQSATSVQTCAYGNGNSTQLTPSSAFVSALSGSNPVFNLTGLDIAFQNTNCDDDVLAVTFVDDNGAPIAFDSSHDTTIEIDDATVSGSSAVGNLVTAHDVKFCASDGTSCTVATASHISVNNSAVGKDVQLTNLVSLPNGIGADAVNNIVLQTYSGFTS